MGAAVNWVFAAADGKKGVRAGAASRRQNPPESRVLLGVGRGPASRRTPARERAKTRLPTPTPSWGSHQQLPRQLVRRRPEGGSGGAREVRLCPQVPTPALLLPVSSSPGAARLLPSTSFCLWDSLRGTQRTQKDDAEGTQCS